MFDCRLLPEFLLIVGMTPPLYSWLRGFVRPYFDTITTSILIALSRSRLRMRPVISATLPNWLSCSCNVVSKHYAPDKNQAIHRMISCHTVPQTKLKLRHLTTRFCDSSWNVCQQISWQRLSQINASPYRLFCLHHRFNRRPTDTIPT